MGLLGDIIAKGVVTAAKNSTIRAVGDAAATVIATKANNPTEKEDVVIKNGVMLIKPTRSSEDYYRKNALDIAKELLGAGFESITLRPVNKLSEWGKRRYGEIESISINGKKEFLGIKKVPSSSYIVIEYLDFKQNVDVAVYASVTKITQGILKRNEPQLETKKSNEKPINETKRFCPYCGSTLSIAGARFCTNCGNAIE